MSANAKTMARPALTLLLLAIELDLASLEMRLGGMAAHAIANIRGAASSWADLLDVAKLEDLGNRVHSLARRACAGERVTMEQLRDI